jgi:hypothetical protein
MDIPLAVLMVGSMYFAGRIAERRGRSFKNWALIAGLALGPLALPLLFLLRTCSAGTASLHRAGARSDHGFDLYQNRCRASCRSDT